MSFIAGPIAQAFAKHLPDFNLDDVPLRNIWKVPTSRILHFGVLKGTGVRCGTSNALLSYTGTFRDLLDAPTCKSCERDLYSIAPYLPDGVEGLSNFVWTDSRPWNWHVVARMIAASTPYPQIAEWVMSYSRPHGLNSLLFLNSLESPGPNGLAAFACDPEDTTAANQLARTWIAAAIQDPAAPDPAPGHDELANLFADEVLRNPDGLSLRELLQDQLRRAGEETVRPTLDRYTTECERYWDVNNEPRLLLTWADQTGWLIQAHAARDVAALNGPNAGWWHLIRTPIPANALRTSYTGTGHHGGFTIGDLQGMATGTRAATLSELVHEKLPDGTWMTHGGTPITTAELHRLGVSHIRHSFFGGSHGGDTEFYDLGPATPELWDLISSPDWLAQPDPVADSIRAAIDAARVALL